MVNDNKILINVGDIVVSNDHRHRKNGDVGVITGLEPSLELSMINRGEDGSYESIGHPNYLEGKEEMRKLGSISVDQIVEGYKKGNYGTYLTDERTEEVRQELEAQLKKGPVEVPVMGLEEMEK